MKERAFSLAEVAVALGVVAFVLVPLVGLLGAGLSVSRRASDETVLAALASTALEEMRRDSLASGTLYFDRDGALQTNSQNAIYRCDLQSAAPTEQELENLSDNFRRVRLTFTWLASSPQPAFTNRIHASVLFP